MCPRNGASTLGVGGEQKLEKQEETLHGGWKKSEENVIRRLEK